MDMKFFYKNDERYLYGEEIFDFKEGKRYLSTVSKNIRDLDKYTLKGVSCISLKSPVDVTKGKCSEEIQKRFGVKFEKKDLPIMNIH